jgi:hypothetical protein
MLPASFGVAARAGFFAALRISSAALAQPGATVLKAAD